MWKIEYESSSCTFIALNPKTYICRDNDTEEIKSGAKGVQRSSNLLVEDYENVLKTNAKKSVQINSLQTFNHEILTMTKQKFGLTNLFLKGFINEDGITITPFKKHISKEE